MDSDQQRRWWRQRQQRLTAATAGSSANHAAARSGCCDCRRHPRGKRGWKRGSRIKEWECLQRCSCVAAGRRTAHWPALRRTAEAPARSCTEPGPGAKWSRTEKLPGDTNYTVPTEFDTHAGVRTERISLDSLPGARHLQCICRPRCTVQREHGLLAVSAARACTVSPVRVRLGHRPSPAPTHTHGAVAGTDTPPTAPTHRPHGAHLAWQPLRRGRGGRGPNTRPTNQARRARLSDAHPPTHRCCCPRPGHPPPRVAAVRTAVSGAAARGGGATATVSCTTAAAGGGV